MTLIQSGVQVIGYEGAALVGENVMFTCPSGQTLNGPNSSMCMGNQMWEPDPVEVNCTFQPTDPIFCQHPQYVLQIGASTTIMTYKEFRNSDFTTSLTCCSGILVIEANTINCLEEELNATQFRYERKCKLTFVFCYRGELQAPGLGVTIIIVNTCSPRLHSLS